MEAIKKGIFLWGIIFLFILIFVSAVECENIPVDGCSVSKSIIFDDGMYNFSSGISILANNVVLDCNNSVFTGFGAGRGISLLGIKNVRIEAGGERNEHFKIKIRNPF